MKKLKENLHHLIHQKKIFFEGLWMEFIIIGDPCSIWYGDEMSIIAYRPHFTTKKILYCTVGYENRNG